MTTLLGRLAAPTSALLLCVAAADPRVPQIRDIDGALRDLFRPQDKANVFVFVSSDCPISNGYAPEIQRICADAVAKGARCTLVYEDVSIAPAAVRAHRTEYGYRDMPAVIDDDRTIAKRAGATITPQAVIVKATGAIAYRGRIDNQYAALGKPRRVVTSHDLRDAIDAVVTGKAVPHAETEAIGCFIAPHSRGDGS
jgi:thiol-disulfide isomerase/thioredoxin